MAIRTNSHPAEICSGLGITMTERSCGRVMAEVRARSARLAMAHVVDFEHGRRLTCRFWAAPLDIDANTRAFTNHHVALNIGTTEHRGLKLAL